MIERENVKLNIEEMEEPRHDPKNEDQAGIEGNVDADGGIHVNIWAKNGRALQELISYLNTIVDKYWLSTNGESLNRGALYFSQQNHFLI